MARTSEDAEGVSRAAPHSVTHLPWPGPAPPRVSQQLWPLRLAQGSSVSKAWFPHRLAWRGAASGSEYLPRQRLPSLRLTSGTFLPTVPISSR